MPDNSGRKGAVTDKVLGIRRGIHGRCSDPGTFYRHSCQTTRDDMKPVTTITVGCLALVALAQLVRDSTSDGS